MAVTNLTKRTVDALAPSTKCYVVYDAKLKGFGIRVMPSGRMSWIVEYRPFGGGRSTGKRRLKLATLGDLTPEEARKLAKKQLGDVANGKDPAAHRALSRAQLRVRDLVGRWEQEKPLGQRGKPMTARTRSYTLSRLRHHVVPILGSKPVAEITVADVERMIAAVTAGNTAKTEKGKPRGRIIVRGGSGAARKVASDLSMLMSYAVRKHLISVNPVFAARKPAAGKRTQYLQTHQVAAIGATLAQLEAEGVNPKPLDILRILLLTGCRPGEIEALKWSEIDFQQNCFSFQNGKTGASTRAVSSEALMILARQPKVDGNDYVFPASRGNGYFQGSKKIWVKAREKAGLSDRVRYHARHGFATLSLAAGNSPATVAALMGHSSPRTTLQTYSHAIDSISASAAAKMGRLLSAALDGKTPAPIIALAGHPKQKARR